MAKLIISILLLGSVILSSCFDKLGSELVNTRYVYMTIKYTNNNTTEVEQLDSMYHIGDTVDMGNWKKAVIIRRDIKHQ